MLEGQIENIPPKFWGRKWKIIVTLKDGTVLNDDGTQTQTGLDVSGLRVTGTISDFFASSANPCTITIYNLNRKTEKLILAQGDKIYIELGYQHPELYGEVFSGKIYQVKRGKASSTDYTLTIQALGDYDILTQAVIGTTAKRGCNYRELIDVIAHNSDPELELGEMPKDWGEDKQLSRGMSLVGNTIDVLNDIAESTNTAIRVKDGKINIISLKEQPSDEQFELNYRTGLIGQPVQTQQGVIFQALINPKIFINSWVHINNAYIEELDLKIGDIATIPLDADGLYRVISREFKFDTRGNDWYIKCEALTQTGGIPDFLVDNATKGI